jgi:hypothetical protein
VSAVSRFHFHLAHGVRKILDTTGRECDNLAAPRKSAEAMARNHIVLQMLQDNPNPKGRHYEITDDRDLWLATVKFGDMLPPGQRRGLGTLLLINELTSFAATLGPGSSPSLFVLI